MAHKFSLILLATALLCVICVDMAMAFGDCPSSTKVTTCAPRCKSDSDCSKIGGKCCPDLCNARSCVQPNLLGNTAGNLSPFNKDSAAIGSYCGNVKCTAFEKCQTDRLTKRPQCVRS